MGIGWDHKGSKDWGCVQGHKDVKNYSQYTNFEVANKMIVLEGSMQKSFLELPKSKNPNYSARFKQKEIINKENLNISDYENNDKNFNKNKNNNFDDNEEINFLSTSSKVKTMNQKEMVNKINSMNLSWKAKEYEEFD